MEKVIKELIRNVPDFPKPGIQFKDITPVLGNGEAFQKLVEWFAITIEAAGEIDLVAGIESRGFIIGAAVAHKLGVGFVPIRKPGKLPYKTHQVEYELEYGRDAVQMHTDAVDPGHRVALVDDLLATGGTASAAAQLLEKNGATLTSITFLIELDALGGRNKLKNVSSQNITSLIHY